MKENLLNAEEAKRIAETSDCQLKRVAKEIEEAAKENRNRLEWCVYDTNPAAKENLGHALTKAGYNVKVMFKDSNDFTDEFETYGDDRIIELLISW